MRSKCTTLSVCTNEIEPKITYVCPNTAYVAVLCPFSFCDSVVIFAFYILILLETNTNM